MKWRVFITASCFALLFGCASAAPEPPKPEFKAVATTQDIMESLVAHMAQQIWDSVRIEIDKTGVHEYKPGSREEWQEIAFAAKGLAEASSLLMYEGRVEDRGDWERFTKELTQKSLAAAKAAEDQDADALMMTGGAIYEVCTNCHNAYIEKVEMKRTGGVRPAEAPTTAPRTPPATAPAGQEEKK